MVHARRAGAAGRRRSPPPIRGSGLYGPAPVAEVVKRCDRIIELAKGNPTAEAGAIRSLGVLNAMQGRIDEGRELVRESARILEDLGQKMRAAFVSEAAASSRRSRAITLPPSACFGSATKRSASSTSAI